MPHVPSRAAPVRGSGRTSRLAPDLVVVAILIGVAVIRIVATYNVFNQTNDEPAHIAAGMEWLDRGSYTLEPQHPPLARVAVAIGPYLDGGRFQGGEKMYDTGHRILYAGGHYMRTLTLARLGVLPFFVVAAGIVWLWSLRLFGTTAALFSVAVFTNLPAVLAHAGVATTDMPVTATFLLALFAFCLWLQNPDAARSSLLGCGSALAVLSKLSVLLFLPASVVVVVGLWLLGPRRRLAGSQESRWQWVRGLSIATVVAFAVIWAGYRFSLAPLTTAAIRPHAGIDRLAGTAGVVHDTAYAVAERIPIPARELLLGVGEVKAHNDQGHRAYLLGRISNTGWWYYFPVVLAVKSPLPFIVLVGIAATILVARRRRLDWTAWVPLLSAAVVLLVSLPSRINIGSRHVLVIYPLLSIVAGYGAASLYERETRRVIGRAAVASLLLWLGVSVARAHPDYLGYFNELVSQPQQVLLDSDLDWGQDLLRLRSFLRARNIEAVSLAYFGTADPTRHDIPAIRPLAPYQPTQGWVAISLMCLKGAASGPPHTQFAWLETYQPVALVGRSINVYYLPPATGLPAPETLWQSNTAANFGCIPH